MTTTSVPERHHPDRIRTLDWHEGGVTLQEVVSELTRLHAQIGRAELAAGSDDHPHSRNCVMNLVAVVPDAGAVKRVEHVAADLAAQHPLRLVALELEAAHNVDRVDAWIKTEAHEVGGGTPIQAEVVRLRVTGAAAGQVENLIEPLLVSDVPVFLWWLGTPPAADDQFRRLLGVVEVLLVDSSSFERPFITTLELAEMAPAVDSGIVIGDLQWGRLGGWRELLAQAFTPAARRPFLHGFGAVGIDYVGEGRGNRVAAAMLTGWIASRLGWKLERAVAGAGGTVVAHYGDGHHKLEVQFRSVEAPDLLNGEVSAVRIESTAAGGTLRLDVERDTEQRGRVRMELTIGELETLREWRPMHTPTEAELIVDLVMQRSDPVYVAALEEAADLLRAFR